MEPIYIMQNSFAGGEFSPVMDARQDLQKYSAGLKTMRNFYVLPHGAASNRPGTRFIAETKDSSRNARLIPFQFSEEQAYIIEFGHLYCRFYRNGGRLEAVPGSPYEIATLYTEDDLTLLRYVQSADVLYVVHPRHKPRVLSRTGDTAWTWTDFAYHDGPFMPLNLTATTITLSATTGAITLTASAALFYAGHVGALWKLTHDVEAQTISQELNAVSATTAIKGKGQWKITTHGIWTGKLYAEKSEDDGATWKRLRTYSAKDEYNPADSGTEDEMVLLRVRAFEWTSGTVNIDLEWLPYTVDGIVQITAVSSSTQATATVKNELGGTAATDDWCEGSWSEYRGWPQAVNFYQNRLFFGNTKSESQTLWGSKTGDYINFGVSSPVVDDDAVTVPLVSQQVNAIRSLMSLSEIIGITAGGHWKISGGSDSGVVTPTSVQAVQQGYYGASVLPPLMIGNRILYTQDKGSIVRDIGYDFQSDSYMGTDLTLLAEHLFRNKIITEWAYQQEPHNIVWCVRDDGVLLGFTYLRDQEVLAWHRHDTDGEFESVCTIPGDDRDEVWLIVKRTINGQIKRYVEQLSAPQSKIYYSWNTNNELVSYIDPAEQYFVDCGLSYTGDPSKVFSGLDHLEGKTVSILADGDVYPQQVVTGGSVTFPNPVSKVHIGLPYVCDLQTLNIDFPMRDGTIQTRNKRIVEATLRMENARGAWIGANFKKMYEIKMREHENWDAPIELFTGDKTIPLMAGSNKNGQVCIRMTDPLPITVLAIVSKVVMDG